MSTKPYQLEVDWIAADGTIRTTVIDSRFNPIAGGLDLDDARSNAKHYASAGFWLTNKLLVAPGAIRSVAVVKAK